LQLVFALGPLRIPMMDVSLMALLRDRTARDQLVVPLRMASFWGPELLSFSNGAAVFT